MTGLTLFIIRYLYSILMANFSNDFGYCLKLNYVYIKVNEIIFVEEIYSFRFNNPLVNVNIYKLST